MDDKRDGGARFDFDTIFRIARTRAIARVFHEHVNNEPIRLNRHAMHHDGDLIAMCLCERVCMFGCVHVCVCAVDVRCANIEQSSIICYIYVPGGPAGWLVARFSVCGAKSL